jgi:hypothetical protein
MLVVELAGLQAVVKLTHTTARDLRPNAPFCQDVQRREPPASPASSPVKTRPLVTTTSNPSLLTIRMTNAGEKHI